MPMTKCFPPAAEWLAETDLPGRPFSRGQSGQAEAELQGGRQGTVPPADRLQWGQTSQGDPLSPLGGARAQAVPQDDEHQSAQASQACRAGSGVGDRQTGGRDAGWPAASSTSGPPSLRQTPQRASSALSSPRVTASSAPTGHHESFGMPQRSHRGADSGSAAAQHSPSAQVAPHSGGQLSTSRSLQHLRSAGTGGVAFGRSATSTSLQRSPSEQIPARRGSAGVTDGRAAASQPASSSQLTHDQLPGDGHRSGTSSVTLSPRPASVAARLRREVSFSTQRPRSAAGSGMGRQTAPASPSPRQQGSQQGSWPGPAGETGQQTVPASPSPYQPGSQQGSWPSRARSEASERSSPEEEALYHRLHEELAAEQQRRLHVPLIAPAAGLERSASRKEALAFGSWQGEERSRSCWTQVQRRASHACLTEPSDRDFSRNHHLARAGRS